MNDIRKAFEKGRDIPEWVKSIDGYHYPILPEPPKDSPSYEMMTGKLHMWNRQYNIFKEGWEAKERLNNP